MDNSGRLMTDFDDITSGKLPQDKLSKIARGEPLDDVDRLGRGLRSSAAERLAQDYLESPSVNVARTLHVSPEARFAREFAQSSLTGLGNEAVAIASLAASTAKMSAIEKALGPPPGYKAHLALLEPFAFEQHALAKITAIMPGIDPKIFDAIRGIQPLKIDSSLADAVQHAQRQIEEAMRPLGGISEAFATFELQRRETDKAMLGLLAGPIGDIARTGQWASILSAVEPPNFAQIFGDKVGAAVGAIQESVTGAFSQEAMRDQAKMSAIFGLSSRLETDFAATQLKMSALAGISETFSARSDLQLDAYHSLFGAWRTRSDLPDNYWRDGRVRKRMYREAEVDDGLIVATPGVALEVMIESGLTAGMRSETNAVAIVTLGEVSMTIRSRGTRRDAYAVLERFETELRAYVSRKLEERFGEDWFKLRASNLIGKAKAIRKAAMERGEAFAPLIDFIELGELAGLILSTKNWDEVFGEIFINQAAFDQDMQKLIAARRPTAHIRTVDGVRLVELICVVQRLSQQMADDGAWNRQAELDR